MQQFINPALTTNYKLSNVLLRAVHQNQDLVFSVCLLQPMQRKQDKQSKQPQLCMIDVCQSHRRVYLVLEE